MPEFILLMQGPRSAADFSNVSRQFRWGVVRTVLRAELRGKCPGLRADSGVYSLCESAGIYNCALGPKRDLCTLPGRRKKDASTDSHRVDELYVGGTRIDRTAIAQYLQLIAQGTDQILLLLAEREDDEKINIANIGSPELLTRGEAVRDWPNLMRIERRSVLLRDDRV